MEVNHERNYRMSLPLGLILGLLSISTAVVFVVYAAEWNETKVEDNSQRATLSYQATVITLLILLVFFNGYHLTKIKMFILKRKQRLVSLTLW
jgi:hypothetical protein